VKWKIALKPRGNIMLGVEKLYYYKEGNVKR
jgi:hypothetical protein